MSFWWLLFVVIGHPGTARGQFRADSVCQDFRRVVGDAWSVWTSPIHATHDDLPGLAAATVLTGIAARVDQPLEHWIKNHPDAWPLRTLKHVLSEEARYPGVRARKWAIHPAAVRRPVYRRDSRALAGSARRRPRMRDRAPNECRCPGDRLSDRRPRPPAVVARRPVSDQISGVAGLG